MSVPSEKTPPKLLCYLNIGLIRGQNFVCNMISNIPNELDKGVLSLLTPDWNEIKEFLLNSNYVVMNTDKNLGLAVLKHDWILDKY